MAYSGYSGSQRPRTIRVVLGGLLAIACFLVGSVVMTQEYHRALTMKEQPESLDWKTLAERGLLDNAYVRLTDVDLAQTNPQESFEKMFGGSALLSSPDPEQAVDDFVEAMEGVDPLMMVELAVAPVKVIPRGTVQDEVRDAIVIPRVERLIEEAERQLAESGSLSGFVSTYQGDEFVRAIVAYTGGEEMLAELDAIGVGQQKTYTIEPMDGPLDRSAAASNFWLCGIGLALGLILCGSGGPSLATCVFFPLPSIISLVGYPMRYGRGEKTTRLVYLLIGGGLVGYGYQLLMLQGQFGQVGGNPLFHSLGFISLFVGLAAVLAAPAQIIARKVNASLDVAPSEKQEPKISVTDACSLTPLDGVDTGYRDRVLTASAIDHSSDQLRQHSESLTVIGFQPAEFMRWQAEDTNASAAIQIGCQEMVVSDTEDTDGGLECRMISMLQDGMTVITICPKVTAESDRRVGSNGIYLRSQTDDPQAMLAAHLEETISVAEKRDTSVVTFDAGEVADVCLLARRVFEDIRYQYGESTTEVDAARYGRFSFPRQPVAETMAV